MKARPEQAAALTYGIVERRLIGAACAGMAPRFDLDPLPGETERADRLTAADRICAGCRVGSECAAVATELGSRAVGSLWAGRARGRITRRDTS